MKAYIKTYGCTLNQADSDIMESLLQKSGAEISQDPDSADVVVLNTCTVKKPTEQKILHALKLLKGRKVVVAGCMASTRRDEILGIAPNASIVTTSNVHMIADAVSAAALGESRIFDGHPRVDKLTYLNQHKGTIAKVPVSDGCISSCAFCETKLARGPLQSYSEQLILKAIEGSARMGAKEIQLTSQDMGAYGADRRSNVAELMQKIAALDGDFRVRVGMLNPEHIGRYIDQFIAAMQSDRFYKFVHLPMQSGSNRVLSHMKRRCTVEQFLEYVAELRRSVPGITIETDIIVGYPIESLSDFDATIDLVNRARPEVTNISKFCSRPNTPAAKLATIANTEVSRRSAILSRVVRSLQKGINERFIGRRMPILTTESTEKSTNGRSASYKQVVMPGEVQPLGSMLNTRIYAASSNVLYGKVS